MKQTLGAFCWPLSQLGVGVEALARKSRLAPRPVQIPAPPSSVASQSGAARNHEALNQWIESAAGWLGLEAEPFAVPYEGLHRMLKSAGPAVLRLDGDGNPEFLLVLPRHRRRMTVLAPDLRIVPMQTETVRDLLCRDLEEPAAQEIDQLLEEAGIASRRRGPARRAMLRERLGSKQVGACWLLRQSPGSSFWAQAQRLALPSRLGLLLMAHVAEYALLIASWWLIGRAALAGHLDYGWLLAWALILLTLVPFRLLSTWLQGVLGINAGILFKQRLLFGALRLKPDEIRRKGVGQFLGQVMESEAVEALALTVGFQGLTAAVELIAAEIVLSQGAGRTFELMILPVWVAITLLMGARYFRDRQRWTQTRLAMTNDLTERMVGHRTRLAQEPRQNWHAGEDEALERYLDISGKMDGAAARLTAIAPRGWLVLGLVGMTWAFVTSSQSSNFAFAIALGGILLAYRALKRLAAGLASLADAVISWQQVAPLFHAAARPDLHGSPAIALGPSMENGDAGAIMEAHDLIFCYQDRGEPVLRGCNLAIRAGDRVLLEGSSGGGKSTLASLLIGMRSPQSGLLLFRGLDRQTIGDQGWRRRVASAPQFHENHVLTGTFAFNLLMARHWLPHEKDMEEAETICRELGLGPLLEKMPAGMLQMVGESGWQLSHGERSRLYIARALLQGADILIFDESFAALDPENVRLSLDCVLNRARTALVMAHP